MRLSLSEASPEGGGVQLELSIFASKAPGSLCPSVVENCQCGQLRSVAGGAAKAGDTLCDAMQCVRSEVEWIVCFLCQADGLQEEEKKMSVGKNRMGEYQD